jgi:hypothetical protein
LPVALRWFVHIRARRDQQSGKQHERQREFHKSDSTKLAKFSFNANR